MLDLIAPPMDAGQDDLVHKREAAAKMEEQMYDPGKSIDPLAKGPPFFQNCKISSEKSYCILAVNTMA